MHHVHSFLCARKGESLTLHDVLDRISISQIPWLRPNHVSSDKMSRTDFEKRKQIFAEFIYYLFDSLLMPLVKSNFHVTESNVHRNRLFYFRHDVWKKLTEPPLVELKTKMFQEMDLVQSKRILSETKLGYSYVRLLPKASGFRPIANLKRRQLNWQGGKKVLSRSINSIMTPVFKVLNYEKVSRGQRCWMSRSDKIQNAAPASVGCSLFSIGDIYPKLRAFADRVGRGTQRSVPLYFAKVDVQACFDTVPQEKVVKVVKGLLTAENYHVERFAVVKPPQTSCDTGSVVRKPRLKYLSAGGPVGRLRPAADATSYRQGSVFVGSLGQQAFKKKQVMTLLEEHIGCNIVKFGKKYYRQKDGIPQGSILSSLLCNFFYGKLEREVLPSLGGSESVLFRLVDDFLLVTTDRRQAEAFLRTMYGGIPEYGVVVKPEKSLVNFDLSVDGVTVPRSDDQAFPYCGLRINTANLNILKETETKAHSSKSTS
jgi:telomerase reverse transcriptase